MLKGLMKSVMRTQVPVILKMPLKLPLREEALKVWCRSSSTYSIPNASAKNGDCGVLLHNYRVKYSQETHYLF